jgi:hypothetical protein
MRGGTGRHLCFIETPRDFQFVQGKRVVVPSDIPDQGDIVRDERLGLKPVPSHRANAPWKRRLDDLVRVRPVRPEFVIPRDEELWAVEPEPSEASLQCVAIKRRGIADEEQNIPAGAVHPVDQFVRQRPAARMVIVNVGGDQKTHED